MAAGDLIASQASEDGLSVVIPCGPCVTEGCACPEGLASSYNLNVPSGPNAGDYPYTGDPGSCIWGYSVATPPLSINETSFVEDDGVTRCYWVIGLPTGSGAWFRRMSDGITGTYTVYDTSGGAPSTVTVS